MSENLIYGADITAYGAVADGKTDCSEAFIKAIENGESLIVVPYGRYFIGKTIELNSNTKIHIHPNAQISCCFGYSPLFKSNNKNSVEICGGHFVITTPEEILPDSLFKFESTNNIKIKDCRISINSYETVAIELESCENVQISGCSIENEANTALLLSGKCHDITVKDTKVSVERFVWAGYNDNNRCDVSYLNIRNIILNYTNYAFLFSNGSIKELKCENIRGNFSHSFLHASQTFYLEDVDFENINIHASEYHNHNSEQAYFSLLGRIDGLEITNFKRNTDFEARPFIPTLILKPSEDSTAIIDGMLLDSVINARALSKTVDMTTARLTNPTGKFIYTLECGIDKGDALTIPLGDFDSLTIYKR